MLTTQDRLEIAVGEMLEALRDASENRPGFVAGMFGDDRERSEVVAYHAAKSAAHHGLRLIG